MHVPVLLNEVIEYLRPQPNENFVDATIGEGGHALALLEKTAPEGKLLGIDLNLEVLENLRERAKTKNQKSKIKIFSERLILVQDNFGNLKEIIKKHRFGPVAGILFDLGLSSWLLERSGRGFTFQKNEPLDMRYSANIKCWDDLTAAKIVNTYSEQNLVKIFREYGQERYARRIAKNIEKARKRKSIETTFDLVEIIKKSVPKNYWRGRIHPATRTFQALRIAVNKELENLTKALPQALEILQPGGRIVVISFHSLEDRIVKNFFRESEKAKKIEILTKKPIRPSREEVKKNPRSRSARLRVSQRRFANAPRFTEIHGNQTENHGKNIPRSSV